MVFTSNGELYHFTIITVCHCCLKRTALWSALLLLNVIYK